METQPPFLTVKSPKSGEVEVNTRGEFGAVRLRKRAIVLREVVGEDINNELALEGVEGVDPIEGDDDDGKNE
jgi:hypothetical protein